ncbi:MAG: YhcB family protein [Agarilytica sp.]
MVAAIALCIGGLVGAIISRTFIPPEVQKDLEGKLQVTRAELEQYQQDVAQHFADTSKLVTGLTKSYKDVHDHLAKGAIQLTNAEISKKILEAGGPQLGHEAKDALDELSFEPPKDWAPKMPGQAGTLSEEFGLADTPEEVGVEATTVTQKEE